MRTSFSRRAIRLAAARHSNANEYEIEIITTSQHRLDELKLQTHGLLLKLI